MTQIMLEDRPGVNRYEKSTMVSNWWEDRIYDNDVDSLKNKGLIPTAVSRKNKSSPFIIKATPDFIEPVTIYQTDYNADHYKSKNPRERQAVTMATLAQARELKVNERYFPKNEYDTTYQDYGQTGAPWHLQRDSITGEFVKPEDSGKLEHFWVLPEVKKAMQGDELEQTLEKAGLSQTSPRGTETRGVRETTKRDQSFPVGIPGLSQPIPPDTIQKSTYRRNAFFTTPISAYMETQWKDL